MASELAVSVCVSVRNRIRALVCAGERMKRQKMKIVHDFEHISYSLAQASGRGSEWAPYGARQQYPRD